MCKYCESRDFIQMNDTVNYSGIGISLNDQGMLRVRTYQGNPKYNVLDSQDVINIEYCPFCGRKFK